GEAMNNQIYAVALGYATSDTETFDVDNPPYRYDLELTPLPLGVTLDSAVTVTNAAPIAFTVTFDYPATGFTLSDLSVTNGAASDLAGSAADYTFSITPTAEGDVSVILPADSAMG